MYMITDKNEIKHIIERDLEYYNAYINKTEIVEELTDECIDHISNTISNIINMNSSINNNDNNAELYNIGDTIYILNYSKSVEPPYNSYPNSYSEYIYINTINDYILAVNKSLYNINTDNDFYNNLLTDTKINGDHLLIETFNKKDCFKTKENAQAAIDIFKINNMTIKNKEDNNSYTDKIDISFGKYENEIGRWIHEHDKTCTEDIDNREKVFSLIVNPITHKYTNILITCKCGASLIINI